MARLTRRNFAAAALAAAMSLGVAACGDDDGAGTDGDMPEEEMETPEEDMSEDDMETPEEDMSEDDMETPDMETPGEEMDDEDMSDESDQ